MNFLNVKEYGVRKTWDNKWETFAHTPDGKYLMPITWAREVYKTKKFPHPLRGGGVVCSPIPSLRRQPFPFQEPVA